jgi:predicted DsbA family dithiol-disulfide isomerase
VLNERRFKDAVDEDWKLSRQAGVTGVPTYLAGGHSVVGAQPYEVLDRLMAATGAQPRNSG